MVNTARVHTEGRDGRTAKRKEAREKPDLGNRVVTVPTP